MGFVCGPKNSEAMAMMEQKFDDDFMDLEPWNVAVDHSFYAIICEDMECARFLAHPEALSFDSAKALCDKLRAENEELSFFLLRYDMNGNLELVNHE